MDSSHPEGHDAVLKLKGLPYSTTREQVREFFQDYKVRAIEFVSEPDGRPSGLGFVEFESKEEALKALSRNGEYIGERYVRLLHVPKSEMEEQVRLGTLAVPGAAAKLRSRLLRTQQARAVAGYLAPQLLVPTALMAQPGARPLMAMQPHQPGTLLAPYATTSPHSGGQAQLAMDSRLWGSYLPTALPLHQQFAGLSLAAGQRQGAAGGGISVLTPGNLQQQQAVGGGMQAGLQQIQAQHMMSAQQQQQQQQTHQQYHQQTNGNCVLHVNNNAGSNLQSTSSGSASQRTSCAGQLMTDTSVGCLPARASAGSNAPHHHHHHFSAISSHQLAPAGFPSHLPGSVTHTGGAAGIGGQMMQLQGGYPMQLPVGASFNSGLNDASSSLLGGGDVNNGAGAVDNIDAPHSPSGTSSPTTATVKVRGLPYRSSPAEILGFFAGFQYLPDSLQIGLDAAGRPSGEAWLTFASPSEAGRAVKTLNRRYLGTRYLELSCCTS